MCQIFFSYNVKNWKSLFHRFLLKSEKENAKDGFGYSCMTETGKWRTYKKPICATEDPNFMNINSNIIISHIRLVYKETKSESEVKEDKQVTNTHPYTYDNWTFVHHGDLLFNDNGKLSPYQLLSREPRVQKHISKLYDYISPKHKKLIKGSTDSEIIFHLFLSVWENLVHKEKMDHDVAMIESLHKIIGLIKKHKIVNRSNFIFANGEHILVANICINTSDINIDRRGSPFNPLDLFMDTSDGLLVTITKMTRNSVKMDANSFFLLEI
jgi:predicted glutamine amidotransferase